MSIEIDTRRDTITVNGETFDIERESTHDGMGENFTVEGLPNVTATLAHDDMYDSENMLDYCRVGHIIIVHRNYVLGDEQTQPDTVVACERCEGSGYDPERYRLDKRSRYGIVTIGKGSKGSMESEAAILNDKPVDGTVYIAEEDDCLACDGNGEIEVGIAEWAKQTHGATVVLPIWMYDHSGISISTGPPLGTERPQAPGYPYTCPWDAGMCGVVFDTAENREKTGVALDNIEKVLTAEIEEYDRYLRGEVYYYNVEVNDEPQDGCGGIVGTEYAEEELFRRLGDAIEDYLIEREIRREVNTIRGEN